VLGLALQYVLAATGWTSQDLADAAEVSKATISNYVTGNGVQLTRGKLDALVAKLGIGPARVEKAVAAARLVREETPAPASPVDPVGEEWHVLDQAVAFGLGETAHLMQARMLREIREQHYLEDRKEAEARLHTLQGLRRAERRVLVEAAPEFHTWAVCVRLCDESEKKAPHSAREALSWAALACRAARHVPDCGGFRSRLLGFAQPHVGNALRVQGRLRRSERVFTGARRLWEEGSDEAGLLDEGRVLDLEASLCRDQRRFDEAVEFHRQALEVAGPDQLGLILLNMAGTLDVKGDSEAAIELLQEAASLVGGLRHTRLLFGLLFTWANALCKLGRAAEAAPLVAQGRELAEQLRNDYDLVKVLWLEAHVLEGLGRTDAGIAALEQVKRDFAARNMPFDYGLASLDLALLYRGQARWGEVSVLAEEMVRLFKAAGVHREQVAAVSLFRDAVLQGAVSVSFVAQLREYLRKARANPQLRFAECAA